MSEIQLGVIEARFADMIWEHEPVTTSELVKLAEKAFQWKRTTTHTVVKRLCDKGLFINTKGTVTSLISRPQFLSMQSRRTLLTGVRASVSSLGQGVVVRLVVFWLLRSELPSLTHSSTTCSLSAF